MHDLIPCLFCNVDGIVSYMKKQAGPSARELVDMDAVTKFMDSEDYGIIGLFHSLTLNESSSLLGNVFAYTQAFSLMRIVNLGLISCLLLIH